MSINIGGQAFDARLEELWQTIRNKYPEALLNRYARPSERTPTNLWIEKIDPEVRNGEARIRTEIERPIIDYLKGLGYEASLGITAVIPKKILPELEKRPDVALINPYAVTVPALNYASPSDSAPTQWQKGVTGPGRERIPGRKGLNDQETME
ncbi:MAG: hypothetical protein HY673_17150 [Chloroflexi bacterium]|nr:hypothetical protein [Chloroflexota bacterium]